MHLLFMSGFLGLFVISHCSGFWCCIIPHNLIFDSSRFERVVLWCWILFYGHYGLGEFCAQHPSSPSFTSSHLRIFASSHLHPFSSSPLLLFASSPHCLFASLPGAACVSPLLPILSNRLVRISGVVSNILLIASNIWLVEWKS